MAASEISPQIMGPVPVFLRQLINVLRVERVNPKPAGEDPTTSHLSSGIRRAAARHGAKSLSLGFTIDRVVHEYGDICQAINELAIEQKARFSVREFCILNRCLDDAIAEAVMPYALRLPNNAPSGSEDEVSIPAATHSHTS